MRSATLAAFARPEQSYDPVQVWSPNLTRLSIAAPQSLDRYRRTLPACDRVPRSYSYEFSSQDPCRRPRGIVSNAGLVDRSLEIVSVSFLPVGAADQRDRRGGTSCNLAT